MNTDTLRFLDRYVGIPLCWIFTVAHRLAGTGRRSRSLPPPRKVLVIKLSEMGNTVLAYPALGRALAQQGNRDEAMKHYQKAVRILQTRRVSPTAGN